VHYYHALYVIIEYDCHFPSLCKLFTFQEHVARKANLVWMFLRDSLFQSLLFLYWFEIQDGYRHRMVWYKIISKHHI